MRTTIWIPIIALTAAMAGMLAFLAAAPNQDSRVRQSQLGFRSLNADTVNGQMVAIGRAYQAQALREQTRVRAVRDAQAWLIAASSAPTSEAARRVRTVPRDPRARARISAFMTFSNGIPTSRWRVRMQQPDLPVNHVSSPINIAGVIEVTRWQAAKQTDVTRIPVTLTIQPVGATNTRAAIRWNLVDVRERTARKRGVRTYVDPVMEHRERIDLVVDTARRNQVSGLAQHAEAVLSALGKRFTRVNPATVATLWVADDERQGRAISGGQPRPELDALGWTNQSGDVVLDWSKLSSSTRSDVRSTVRHELAHVALRREIGVAPPVLLEGIAVAAELDPALGGGDRSADLRPLVAAFNAGNVGLTQLLRADPKQPFANGQSAAQVATSYLAGYATVMWLREEYGADADARLLGQLANGVAIDDALENIAQGDATSVSRRVAAWTRNEVAST